MTWLPTPDDVIKIHNELVSVFAAENDPISPPGVKTPELLESACARALTSLEGVEKYPTLPEKMAAMFHSLTKNHAFHNGNKRTALVTLLSALHRNDYRLRSTVTDDDVYNLVVNVTADSFPHEDHGLSVDDVVQSLASWIRENIEHSPPRPRSMSLNEFIKRCEQAGARTKPVKGGSISILNGQASIKISRSTRQLDGQAILTYLRRLNLSESAAGLTAHEFQEGASPERDQIRRFISALRRLAKT
ncbi:MAG: type II toxin-antitoxin system death-on-curing family toxin [Pseudomonadota bacterium]